jgi:hypothetical protein
LRGRDAAPTYCCRDAARVARVPTQLFAIARLCISILAHRLNPCRTRLLALLVGRASVCSVALANGFLRASAGCWQCRKRCKILGKAG